MARGWHPPSSASILIQRELSQAVPQAPEFFRPQQQTQGGYVRNRPSFWGIYSKPVPSASLSRYSVGPAFSGDFRLGLYFSFAARRLVTDDEGLVRSSMSHGGGKRLGLSVNG